MNARTTGTEGSGAGSSSFQKAPRRTIRRGADREFLPAALEILDTPPSPIGLALLLGIVALVVVTLAWSWIGHIDVIAIAPGRIQPAGRVKVVQPVDAGRVVAIEVANGAHVEQGAPLFRLDEREAWADLEAMRLAYVSAEAEAITHRAALAAAEAGDVVPAKPNWGADVPTDVRARQEALLAADVGRFVSDRAVFRAQFSQKDAEVRRLRASIAAQQALLATQDIRVGMRSELVKRDAGSRAQLLDAEEARQAQAVSLATMEGQLVEAKATLDVIASTDAQSKANFIADQTQKATDASRAIDDLRERSAKALAHLEHALVTAPISGTVTALTINGIGQVVGAGEEVLRIIPDDSTLELEAHVSNADIGFIRLGQPVAVKIDSFPFTRFGSIEGTIARIAGDSVADPDARQSSASLSAATSRLVGGTQYTQNLIFPVIVKLDRRAMVVDGIETPLASGMTAVAEIKTGSRRMLEYWLSPVIEVGSRAFRER